MEHLRDGERTVNDMVARMGISQPAVSRHLKVPREAGPVTVRVDAQRRIYRLRPEPLAEIEAWVAMVRSFWSEKLNALERYLHKEP